MHRVPLARTEVKSAVRVERELNERRESRSVESAISFSPFSQIPLLRHSLTPKQNIKKKKKSSAKRKLTRLRQDNLTILQTTAIKTQNTVMLGGISIYLKIK